MRLHDPVLIRRSLVAIAPALLTGIMLPMAPAVADTRLYIDPSGRFSLEIPNGFAQSKRTATQGTIFVAGNFPRAATISVNAWPLRDIVNEEARSQALPGLEVPQPRALPASLNSLKAVQDELGGEKAFTQLLLRKLDREKSSGALTSELISSTAQGEGLLWSSSTDLPVADRDALFEQRGLRRLIRRTSSATFLGTVPDALKTDPVLPAVISICGSALESDWEERGPPIERAVASFILGASK